MHVILKKGVKMKKVLFVINSLSNKSGTERVACLLANLFTENMGYSVCIVNRTTIKEQVAYSLNNIIEVKKIEGNPLFFYNGLHDFIKKYKPDSIVVHNMGKLSLLCAFMKLNSKINLISLEHGAFSTRPFYIKFLVNLFYKKIDHIVVLNEFDRREFAKKTNNVHKIYNPSPFSHLKNSNYAEGRRSIIALGRLHPEKNFEHLIMAWVALGNKTDGWILKIFGKGKEYTSLKYLIENNGQANIKLMGEVADAQLAYDEAALYVMSSKNEGLPMVLIEAQSNGIPIVSYDCPHGPSEIITHNVDGLLVENQNIQALSDAINIMLSSFETRERFSKAALKGAERFSNETILSKWKAIL